MQDALTQVLPYLPPALRQPLAALPAQKTAGLEEIRCIIGAPLTLRFGSQESFLAATGGLTGQAKEALICEAELMRRLVLLLTDSSFYALAEELRRGYITLPGGHRAGLAGRALLDESGHVRGLRDISSVNLRLARPVMGASLPLLPRILAAGRPLTTLIAAPPRAGKTTLLRDIAWQLAEGTCAPPLRVGLVDERSELAALYHGQPQLPVGSRTDVLDGCPKAEGLMMLIRSMAPEVLLCDEIGRPEDAAALAEAANAGIAVIASAHAADETDLLNRPVLAQLVQGRAFARVALLSRRQGPGTLEKLLDGALSPLSPC